MCNDLHTKNRNRVSPFFDPTLHFLGGRNIFWVDNPKTSRKASEIDMKAKTKNDQKPQQNTGENARNRAKTLRQSHAKMICHTPDARAINPAPPEKNSPRVPTNKPNKLRADFEEGGRGLFLSPF